ncbi:SANT and BTB domain regulator of class switch recombination isoform X2 [Lampetra planeri]
MSQVGQPEGGGGGGGAWPAQAAQQELLDSVLRSLLVLEPPGDWGSIARLVPGCSADDLHSARCAVETRDALRTRCGNVEEALHGEGSSMGARRCASQCARRFEELKRRSAVLSLVPRAHPAGDDGPDAPFQALVGHIKDLLLLRCAMKAQPSAQTDGVACWPPDVPAASPAKTGLHKEEDAADVAEPKKSTESQGPTMVIHVCDEARGVKRDFSCPRQLLVQEMRYFSEYLSMEAQRWEDVDISVHCDAHIFDWLMRYVKRNTRLADRGEQPQLEPNNVISILISSEFLKMDSLVEECVRYCHARMADVVSAPSNMNCIGEELVMRIADLFTHSQAEELKDRKDKFRSKIFCKKIERLFDAEHRNPDSPSSAASVYRCRLCRRLLTKDTQSKLPCVRSQMLIDRHGEILYRHVRERGWDVYEYLSALHKELKSWRNVYWRLWGTVNYLTCSRCNQVFLCKDLSHCLYHTHPALYGDDWVAGAPTGLGIYPCCKQRTLRFDLLQPSKGCKVRDHVVSRASGGGPGEAGPSARVHQDLLLHRDAVCVPFTPSASSDWSAAAATEVKKHDVEGATNVAGLKKVADVLKVQALLSEDDDYTTGSEVTDDEVGDEEEVHKKRGKKQAKKSIKARKKTSRTPQKEKVNLLSPSPFNVCAQRKKWDVCRSMRYNQDTQREEDQRRMNDFCAYLAKLRCSEGTDRGKTREVKEYPGGIYMKLEAQFRASLPLSRPGGSSQQVARLKARITSMRGAQL